MEFPPHYQLKYPVDIDIKYSDNWRSSWQGPMARTLQGLKAKAFLFRLLVVLNALPEQKLAKGNEDILICMGRVRGIDIQVIDCSNREIIAVALDITVSLVAILLLQNAANVDETSEIRFMRMQEWIENQIKDYELEALVPSKKALESLIKKPKWRNGLNQSIYGLRGQKFLRKLLVVLNNMLEKKLYRYEDFEICMEEIASYDHKSSLVRIFAMLMYENERIIGELPERRWARMRQLVSGYLIG